MNNGQPVKYIFNGQAYDSIEAVRAAMQGGGAPPAVAASDTAGTLRVIEEILSDHTKRDRLVEELFNGYAGADRALQQHEMTGLARILSAKIGIDASFFENIQQMFYRFDFDGNETLDLYESKKLITFLLKEERRALAPRPDCTLCQLEQKNLKQHFELGKKLGQGGQGAVYLAKTKPGGVSRVVKFYEKAGGNSCMDDIKDEFELLKRLDHPNIARVCEVFEDISNIYVISEPYTGGDLVTVMQKGQEAGISITHNWIGKIFLQTIEGIRYLHSKQTMHCDLKEPNVMIADDQHWDEPHCMVIDFGMAKNFSGVRAGGTPGYMPPEFWQYQMWTPKGDMFALAVTFWGIYNSRQGGPFQMPDQPPFKRIAQATCQAPMDCGMFPPGLRECIQAMAEKDFRRRPTAAAVHNMPYFQALSDEEEGQPLDPAMVGAMVKAATRSASQNLIAMQIADSKNLGQMKEMNKLFRQLDTDDDGTVESGEALECLIKLGIPDGPAQQLVESLIGDDGKIHYSEFMGRMIASTEAMNSADLAEVFQGIDKDGSGTLNRSEIEALMGQKNMTSLMEGRSPSDLLAEMDANGDGVVSFSEFQRAMNGSGSDRSEAGYSAGDPVEYYSPSNDAWVPCQITGVDRSGRVSISVKPGAWLDGGMQVSNLRKAGSGKGGGRGGY